MKEYVLGIITKDNYRDFFPEKNPNNESKDSNNQILVVSDANTYATSLLKSELTNTSSPLQIKSFVNSPTEDAPNKTKSIIYCCQTSMIKNNKYFSNNLFNVDALLSAFISIIFFISSVGIIVSFLYRVPGFFAFLFIAAATSLTFLFLVLSGNVISFGIFIGVFAGISMSFLCVLVLISRIKKYTVASKSIGIGVKKGVASSFLQLIDLHILCILIGVSSIYFGIVDIKKFGLTILLYSLVSFALINLV
jgi:SecD/SecF fusion protein